MSRDPFSIGDHVIVKSESPYWAGAGKVVAITREAGRRPGEHIYFVLCQNGDTGGFEAKSLSLDEERLDEIARNLFGVNPTNTQEKN